MGNPGYVVITPVRDEAEHLEQTIHSMMAQTVRPSEWIIVNDGSTDGTGAILDRYAAQVPWIRPVHRTNRGFRKSGGGVMEAFCEGFRALQSRDWAFLVKLDGDLSFAPDYFEKCLAHFERTPKLGIGGGTLFHVINGEKQVEKVPQFHVRGATKIYRRACWYGIEGLRQAPGWDVVDEVKANQLGWSTQSFPDVELIHHRFTGMADGAWRGAVKNGCAYYFSGYHPLFLGARCAYRCFRKPYVVASLGTLWGYVSCYLKRVPQIDDPALIQYLRRQQMNRLLGKETIWK